MFLYTASTVQVHKHSESVQYNTLGIRQKLACIGQLKTPKFVKNTSIAIPKEIESTMSS